MTTPAEQPEIIQKTLDAMAIELGIAGPDASGRNAATRNFLVQQLRTLYDEAKKEGSVFADGHLDFAMTEIVHAATGLRERLANLVKDYGALQPVDVEVRKYIERDTAAVTPLVAVAEGLVGALVEVQKGLADESRKKLKELTEQGWAAFREGQRLKEANAQGSDTSEWGLRIKTATGPIPIEEFIARVDELWKTRTQRVYDGVDGLPVDEKPDVGRSGVIAPLEQKPVVGRMVHYTSRQSTVLAAVICEVHSDLMLTIGILSPPSPADLGSDRPTPGLVSYMLVLKTLHEAGTEGARHGWSWPKFF